MSETIDLISPLKPIPAILDEGIQRMIRSGFYSNRSDLVTTLERAITEYLGLVSGSLVCVSSATQGLVVAQLAANVTGGLVAICDFGFKATMDSLLLAGNRPILVDVDPETGVMSLDSLREAIKLHPEIKAVIPTLTYSNVEGIKQIEQFCTEICLPLILDASHSFPPLDRGSEFFCYGDIAVISMHATKLMTTCEGGIIWVRDPEKQQTIIDRCNFSLSSGARGTNSKLSELNAAFGLAILPLVNQEIQFRTNLAEKYCRAISVNDHLKSFNFISRSDIYNGSYFPIIVDDTNSFQDYLSVRKISSRRYFNPPLSGFSRLLDSPVIYEEYPHAKKLSSQIVCVPIHGRLNEYKAEIICSALKEFKC